MREFWDQRYTVDDYIFGIEPNAFFKEHITPLPVGKALFFAEGEGRNAVYAASLGWTVDAVDWSGVARAKALRLAEQKHVTINYSIHDATRYQPSIGEYDAVICVFFHLPPEQREHVHHVLVDAVKPGGIVIVQAYSKEQLGKNTGGPQDADLLYSLEDIVTDFIDLEFDLLTKEIVMLDEGKTHKGESSVIGFIGRKPKNIFS